VIGNPTVVVQFVSRTARLSTWQVVGSVTYVRAGLYLANVQINEVEGATLISTRMAFDVANGLLRDVTPASTQQAAEGRSTGPLVLATFTDTNPQASLSDYVVTVDWGGTLIGTPSAEVRLVSRTATVSRWQVVGTATFAARGQYLASVRVNEIEGASFTSTKTKIAISNGALTNTTVPSTQHAVAGTSSGRIVLATFTDTNPQSTQTDYAATVNWGGTLIGTPMTSIELVSRSATRSTWQVVGLVTYASEGIYTLTVRVDDNEGATFSSTKTRFDVISQSDANAVWLTVPVLNVPGDPASLVPVVFTLQSVSARYSNEFGIIAVDDGAGRIGGLLPGDNGYAKAAFSENRWRVLFPAGTNPVAKVTLNLTGGSHYVLYGIQNSSTQNHIRSNLNNIAGLRSVAFFSVRNANPDNQFDHFRNGANHQIGFEDLLFGGDKDFNDAIMTVKADLSNVK
jgi:hypothetical protein